MQAAPRNSSARSSSRVNINEIADDLAQDIMETMIISQDDDDGDLDEDDAQEALMSRLE